jgi:hypothetical protein
MKMLHMTEYALYEIHPNGGINDRNEFATVVKGEM